MAEISNTISTGLPQTAKEVIACAVVMVVLAALIVALRIYTRLILLRTFGKDDFCILLALLFSIGNSVGMGMQATTALGHHIWDLAPEDVMMFLKLAYFTIVSYNIGLSFVKLSILFLYFRLFTSAESALRRVSHVIVTIVVLVNLWSILSSVLFCLPVASFWDKSIGGKCLPSKPMWYAAAALNIITDFMILILPLPNIKNLQLPRRQKLALSLIFAMGFFVCIVSIIRLHSLTIAANSTDPTGDNPGVAKWSTIEINTAIICPSVATLRPLASRIFPRLLETLNRSKGATDPSGSHRLSSRGSHARKSRVSRTNQTTFLPATCGGSTEEILEEGVEWNNLDEMDGKSGMRNAQAIETGGE